MGTCLGSVQLLEDGDVGWRRAGCSCWGPWGAPCGRSALSLRSGAWGWVSQLCACWRAQRWAGGVMLVQPIMGGIADPPRCCWFAGISSGCSPCSGSAPLQTLLSLGQRLGAAGWCPCLVSHPCRVASSTLLGLRRVPAAPGATQRGEGLHSPAAGVSAPTGDKGDFSIFNESTAIDSF